MNPTKGLYDNCPNFLAKSFKAERSFQLDINKENASQGELLSNRNYYSHRTGLSERISDYKDYNKQKDLPFSDLIEAIEQTEKLQQVYIKNLDLKKAQETKEKVNELKKEFMLKRKQQIEDKYNCELDKLTESQAKEMNEFNEFWDQKVEEFEIEANNIEKEMRERHKQEQVNVEDELEKVIPMKKKVSTQYLNYKKSLDVLVKQKEFVEADHVKSLCADLEREERNKAFNEKKLRMKFFMGQLEQRQKNELKVLSKRISTGREELLKAKVLELETLLHKFQNSRFQFEQSKQLELSKFELTQNNYKIGIGEGTNRSFSKTSARSKSRQSNNRLKLKDSSRVSRVPSLNISMSSPTNHTPDIQASNLASPTIDVARHKRSATRLGKSNMVISINNMNLWDRQGEIKTVRSHSVLKN